MYLVIDCGHSNQPSAVIDPSRMVIDMWARPGNEQLSIQ